MTAGSIRTRCACANIRPARTINLGQHYDNIELVPIREGLEGLYVSFEHYVPVGDDPQAIASGINNKAAADRIIRFAFEYAVRNGRNKVTVVHKAKWAARWRIARRDRRDSS